MSKEVTARLHDPAYWLPLAAWPNSRNLVFTFFDISVERNVSKKYTTLMHFNFLVFFHRTSVASSSPT